MNERQLIAIMAAIMASSEVQGHYDLSLEYAVRDAVSLLRFVDSLIPPPSNPVYLRHR